MQFTHRNPRQDPTAYSRQLTRAANAAREITKAGSLAAALAAGKPAKR